MQYWIMSGSVTSVNNNKKALCLKKQWYEIKHEISTSKTMQKNWFL